MDYMSELEKLRKEVRELKKAEDEREDQIEEKVRRAV
jgi:hypothetical protein